MSQVKVQLVNPGDADVSVGIDTTLVVATAGEVTQASLEDTSGEAYGLLLGGVTIVPADASIADVIELLDVSPEPVAQAVEPEPDE